MIHFIKEQNTSMTFRRFYRQAEMWTVEGFYFTSSRGDDTQMKPRS